jgi:hypothetical protein
VEGWTGRSSSGGGMMGWVCEVLEGGVQASENGKLFRGCV